MKLVGDVMGRSVTNNRIITIGKSSSVYSRAGCRTQAWDAELKRGMPNSSLLAEALL